MTSELSQWLTEHMETAIKDHEARALTDSDSFGELYEQDQYRALAEYFNRVPGVRAQSDYPFGTRGREAADLYIETGDHRLICEYKAMYKTWFLQKGRPYPAYLWSPFDNPTKTHSAGHDLWKLATLPASDITHAVQILFSSSLKKDNMPGDFDRYARLACIDKEPWCQCSSRWEYPGYTHYEWEVRVWVCPLAEMSSWRHAIRSWFQ
jgi:hypothetical protein